MSGQTTQELLKQLLQVIQNQTSSSSMLGSQQTSRAEPTDPPIAIKRIVYKGYKALRDFEIDLRGMNVFTGSNNAGKSTALSALRLLGRAITTAGRRNPERISTPDGIRPGYHVKTTNIEISVENVHTDLIEQDSSVTFYYQNDESLVLWFPPDGGCFLYVAAESESQPRTASTFRRAFNPRILQVPVLGPLEYGEPLLLKETVQAGVMTHRACRHFRNFWYHFPEDFDRFASLLESTWPGMTVTPPELNFAGRGSELHMFCEENRRSRELYWAGFGFQIWCQLLTHICRAESGDLLLVDEPETYLHPQIQSKLPGILRQTGAQVVLATHSASIIMAAAGQDILIIDKRKSQAIRQTDQAVALAAQLGLLESSV